MPSVPKGEGEGLRGATGGGVGTAPTVPKSVRGLATLDPRLMVLFALGGEPDKAPEPVWAGTPKGLAVEVGTEGVSSLGSAGDRNVRFKHVNCSIGLRCTKPVYNDPGVCNVNGDGESAPAGVARYFRPIAISECSVGGRECDVVGVPGGD